MGELYAIVTICEMIFIMQIMPYRGKNDACNFHYFLKIMNAQ